MKYRFFAFLTGVSCVAAILGALALLKAPEPKFQDKPVSYWARLLVAEPTRHRELLPRLGPILVPYFVQELEAYRPNRPDTFYQLQIRLYLLAPEALRRRWLLPVPPDARCLNAINLLGELGPVAKDAVPRLIPLLDDETMSTSVLKTLGLIGPEARQAIPKLTLMLKGFDEAEPFVATTLLEIGAKPEQVIPLLRRMTNSASAYRGEAKILLERLDVSPREVRERFCGR
jgi:hypothetical protein